MAKTKTTKRRHNSVGVEINQSSRSRRRKKVVGSPESTDEDRPSTSSAGSIHKKRGLSLRDGNQGENRQQQDKRKTSAKMDDTSKKPKRKKTEASSRKSHKEMDYDEQYAERVVSAQAVSKWKPMSKNTREFVLEALDSAIVYTLNETNSSSYDDVQDRLNILRQRIVGALSDVTVPTTGRQPDYRNMEQQCHSVEVSVAEASNQVVLLEEEIQEQMREIDEKERQLEELKSTQKDQNNNAGKIHPILQEDTQNALELPVVKAAIVKAPKASSSSTTSSSHTSLVQALKKWQSQDTVQDIGMFMDTLSNITSTLPQ